MKDCEEKIKDLFTKVRDLNAECALQDCARHYTSNKHICESLDHIIGKLNQMQQQQDTQDGSSKISEANHDGRGNTEESNEAERMRDNIDYMEAVDEQEEEKRERNNEDEYEDQEENEQDNEDEYDNEEANNERNYNNRELDESEILKEFDDLVRELAEVHYRIRDLLRMRTCQPLFEEDVTRQQERTMPCSFCYAPGHHYSDPCTKITGATEREAHPKSRGRCTICLQFDCQEGFYNKKYSIRCHHCNKTGHASAICKLPEESVEIFAERNNLENIAEQMLKRLEELRRRV